VARTAHEILDSLRDEINKSLASEYAAEYPAGGSHGQR